MQPDVLLCKTVSLCKALVTHRGTPMKWYIAISIVATLTLAAALGDDNQNKEAQKIQGSCSLSGKSGEPALGSIGRAA